MKYLGIDFGKKRVGLAISDESGKLAFPKVILSNDKKLILEIKNICQEDSVGGIVIGESLDKSGRPNLINKEIKIFTENFKKETGLPIYFEKEIWTTVEARRFQGKKKRLDASAAAIILQRFLEKTKNI